MTNQFDISSAAPIIRATPASPPGDARGHREQRRPRSHQIGNAIPEKYRDHDQVRATSITIITANSSPVAATWWIIAKVMTKKHEGTGDEAGDDQRMSRQHPSWGAGSTPFKSLNGLVFEQNIRLARDA